MTEEIQKDKSNSQALLFVDRIMDTVDMVVRQFTSGRWILTVAAAIILVSVCWGNVEKAEKFKEIIAVIIYAYFQRNDRGTENKTTETKSTSTSEVKT